MGRLTFIWICCLPLVGFSQEQIDIPQSQERINQGQEVFNNKCSRCHELGKQSIGPSLASVTDKRSIPWLINFIRNSQDVIEMGDPYAVHLFKNYHHMAMPNNRELSDSVILNMLAYIQHASLAKNYDHSGDSINDYDEEVLSKVKERYSQVQDTESAYFNNRQIESIPNDPGSIQQGENLYNALCNSCHSFDKRKTGPALASVTDRLPVPWLLDFISNPKQMLESGDDYANFLASNYPLVMPEFQSQLTKNDMLNILGYIRYETGAKTHVAGINANKILDKHNDPKYIRRAPHDSEAFINHSRDISAKYPLFKSLIILLTVSFVAIILWMQWRIFQHA